MSSSDNLTRLLREVEAGTDGSMDRLMDAVYDDLRHVAERHMNERFGRGLPGVTLEPAALVNESFMKLIRQRNTFDNRGHFFAIATRVMLRVLLDYQRQRRTERRGGQVKRVTLSIDRDADPATPSAPVTLIGVDALIGALDRLDELDRRKADVVRLRVIWGLTMTEIAGSLGVSIATVERDWSFAKAWLAREAAGDPGAADSDVAATGEG